MYLSAASLAQHGNVPWQSFTLKYNRDLPDDEVPALWMKTDFDAWYRDPHTLIHNISNPDFKDEFNYAPYQALDLFFDLY